MIKCSHKSRIRILVIRGSARMIASCIDCSKCESYLATRSGTARILANIADRMAKRYNTEVSRRRRLRRMQGGERHFYFCSNTVRMRNAAPGRARDLPGAATSSSRIFRPCDHVPDARATSISCARAKNRKLGRPLNTVAPRRF
jgi:hypothetical protein